MGEREWLRKIIESKYLRDQAKKVFPIDNELWGGFFLFVLEILEGWYKFIFKKQKTSTL